MAYRNEPISMILDVLDVPTAWTCLRLGLAYGLDLLMALTCLWPGLANGSAQGSGPWAWDPGPPEVGMGRGPGPCAQDLGLGRGAGNSRPLASHGRKQVQAGGKSRSSEIMKTGSI